MTLVSDLTAVAGVRMEMEWRDPKLNIDKVYNVEGHLDRQAPPWERKWACTASSGRRGGVMTQHIKSVGVSREEANQAAMIIMKEKVRKGYTRTSTTSIDAAWLSAQLQAVDLITRTVDRAAFDAALTTPGMALINRRPGDTDWRIAVTGQGLVDVALEAGIHKACHTVNALTPFMGAITMAIPANSVIFAFERLGTLHVQDALVWGGVDLINRPWAARRQLIERTCGPRSATATGEIAPAHFLTSKCDREMLVAGMMQGDPAERTRIYMACDIVQVTAPGYGPCRHWFDERAQTAMTH